MSGKCWANACCVGCYDTDFSECWEPSDFSGDDDTCGKNGQVCVDCEITNKVCTNYVCQVPTTTGPCAGKNELDSCVDGGYTGKCIAGVCCTGCYYADAGSVKCQKIPNDAHCGKMGGSCAACKPYQACQGISGACVLDLAAKFKLEATRADIFNDPNKKWDSEASTAPDPFLGILFNVASCASTVVDKCTGKVSDTYHPVWSFDLGTYTAAHLLGEHCVSVSDVDGPIPCASPSEVIGRCMVAIPQAALEAGVEWVMTCTNPDDFKNYITGIRFGFTYVP